MKKSFRHNGKIKKKMNKILYTLLTGVQKGWVLCQISWSSPNFFRELKDP